MSTCAVDTHTAQVIAISNSEVRRGTNSYRATAAGTLTAGRASECQAYAVHSLLEVMVEPLSRSLAMAPVEEEDLTDETIAAIEQVRKSLDARNSISHEEILREFVL